MRRPDFEAFFYSDDYLKNVALHHHDFYEIYLFLSGLVRYTVESRHYELLPGDILLISPQELHQPVFGDGEQQPYSRVVIWVNAQLLRDMGAGHGCDLTRCFDVASPDHTNLLRLEPSLRQPVFDLALALVERDAAADPYSGLLAVSQLTELLVRLNRLRSRNRLRYEQEYALSSTMQAVVAFINGHLSEPLTLDRLAQRHYISKYHLAHSFQQAMGASVCRYITQKRLILARQLIVEGVPLNRVHKRCGFPTYSSFYRAFRGVYGIPPRDYRRTAAD